jgi:phosphoribosylanthranilate isomerase
MTWIKICGITNVQDAVGAVESGADALGFVFYPKSPRNMPASAVREIVGQLPQKIEKVGVFVEERPHRAAEVARESGLTAVQMYGMDLQNVPLTSELKWIPAFSANHLPPSVPHQSNLFAVLVDSGSKETPGGTGITFEWPGMQEKIALLGTTPVIVAGGLTSENISDAIGILKPWGVDVSSGVERSPGHKDPTKVQSFIQAVRKAETSQLHGKRKLSKT